MRVLIAPEGWGAVGPAETAAAMADGWRECAAGVPLETCPQTDGGPGFVEAIAAALPAATALPGLPALQHEQTVFLSASDLLGAPVRGGSDLTHRTSTALGEAIASVVQAGFKRLVIGVGECAVLDGGQGMIQALAEGHPEQADRPVAAARQRLAGIELVAGVNSDRVLLGLQGACASMVQVCGLDRQAAQDAEAAMGVWVDQVRRQQPEQRELISHQPIRRDRLPGAGAGGGVGFGLAALGAQLRSGAGLSAQVSRLQERVAAASLVVTATRVYDWRVLQHSVIEQVSMAASAAARPAILLSHESQVGRRETMSLGYSGAYSVLPPGSMSAAGAVPTRQQQRHDIRVLAARVARTWTPPTVASGSGQSRS